MDNLLKLTGNSKEEIESFTATDKNDAEVFRIKFLGSKGLIKSLMKEMKNVSPENKKQMGLVLNDLKLLAEKKYEELAGASNNGQTAKDNPVDLTLPGDALPLGSRHPISIVKN